MKNYLPFAVRETRTVFNPINGAGAPRQAVQIGSMDVGFGNRVILGDMSVYAYQATGDPSTQILMRLGWLGKGYILEKRLPAGTFLSKSRPLVPVWKFPKPYILWPNEQLRARIDVNNTNCGAQGVMFSGRRLVDDRPQLLYDTSEEAVANGSATGFDDTTLRCPGDSPVELHSVSITDWAYDKTTNTSVVQVWSPQGRAWFQESPFAGPPPAVGQKWIDPAVDLTALGEERGWVLGSGQTFLAEFENTGNTSVDMIVQMTLRGSIEVDVEERHG
ncbi:MAG: hypothetical protein ACYTBJ_00075 [Planctomycetota bacterium]|jgi:hypothetical protein